MSATSIHPIPALDDRVLAGVVTRSRNAATLERFCAQGEGCGWCAHPIRLKGTSTTVDRATGEVMGTYSSATEPDGVLLKACGTRRATRCPSCATTYRADARMLVRAGLGGGKGIPPTVAKHPVVFATFTAPSFGAVHGTRSGNHPCRPGARDRRCPHGCPVACWARHDADDPVLGEPLCGDCYDYERAVLWNARCPELWRRTTTYITRELARLAGTTAPRHHGTTAKGLHETVRLSFAKVAEYQRRGVVHLHAVIRLDAAGDERTAPGEPFSVAMLAGAVRTAVTKVTAPYPSGFGGLVRWGEQIEVRAIAAGASDPTAAGARAVANYVAKYATKSTDDAGALDRPLRGLGDLDARAVTGHLRRLVETAWRLGEQPDLTRLRAWAHTLGFGGHWLTKSRRYSVTFAFLRHERQMWQVARQRGQVIEPEGVATVGSWTWAGTGWRTRGDAWLASQGRHARTQARLEAREAKCMDGTRWLSRLGPDGCWAPTGLLCKPVGVP